MPAAWKMWKTVGGMGEIHAHGKAETAGTVFDAKIVRRALAYFRPYRRQVAFAVLAILAASALGLVPPLLVKGLIDSAIPAGIAGAGGAALLPYVVGLVLVPILASLIGIAQMTATVRVGQGVVADLREEIFLRVQDQSLDYHTSTRVGEVAARVSDDPAALESSVTGTVVEFISSVVTVAGTLTVLFVISWPLALAACLCLPVVLIPARRVGRMRRKLSGRVQERTAELSAALHDVLGVGGYLLARLFGRTGYEAGRFREQSRELAGLRMQQAMAGRWFGLILAVVGSLGPALVFFFGGLLVIRGEVSVGTVVAFVAYLSNLYRPVFRLVSIYSDAQSAMGVFARVFSTLDRNPTVVDRADAPNMPPIVGEVAFEGVTFAYPGANSPAVQSLSFRARPGQLVALVGPSGAGKTTTTYLLSRFHDPQSGRVLIDGRDVRDFAQLSVSSQVGMVTQETYLFHDTLRANLLYARGDATPEQLIEACRAAQIHDFIERLPEGYDTLVGERGVKLSGGERQRVSIARALLKNPRLLVLDEATSALDSASERLIRDALAPLMRDRTTFAIAHRLSTVLAADLILVLAGGRLVESGTHAELLARGGLYAELYREQFHGR